MNLLTTAAIRVVLTDGARAALTLPGVLAALARDEIESFVALRPHQRAAWHSFLVQVAALALLAAGRSDLPQDEASWAALLRGLTPDFPDDEPWSLVTPPDRPALLQAPIPGGRLGELKNTVETPSQLDILTTAKNHDVKTEVLANAETDHWVFSLVCLQTAEQYGGSGLYGVSRMNGGSSTRPSVGVAPGQNLGARFRRDVERLMHKRKHRPNSIYPVSGGIGLLWLVPWEGMTSLRPEELDEYYVEVCRRVRLTTENGHLRARTAGSKVRRVAEIPGGVTGDPWAPLRRNSDGTHKVLSIPSTGFGYRRMVDIMFNNAEFKPSPLQELAPEDDRSGLAVVAMGLSRGNCVTEGYHERLVPISNAVKGHMLGGLKASDLVASAARERVQIAGTIQNSVLRSALMALFQNGNEKKGSDKGSSNRAEAFLARFDEAVDADFFPKLWQEFEDGADPDAVRAAWVRDLLAIAGRLLDDADRSASKAVKRRYRARSKADAVLFGAPRRNPLIAPYLVEPKESAA